MPIERVLLVGSVLLVLIVELLNSSVEVAVDHIGLDTHRLAKGAKDLGIAAVLVALIIRTFTGVVIALPVIRVSTGLPSCTSPNTTRFDARHHIRQAFPRLANLPACYHGRKDRW